MIASTGVGVFSAISFEHLPSLFILFWALSLIINILVTVLVVSRLLFYRRRLVKLLGASYGSQYTGIIALLVESEVLYTTFLLTYIAFFVLNTPVVTLFLQVLPPVSVRDSRRVNLPRLITPVMAVTQSIAALLIVYRVAQGKSWKKDTVARMTRGAGGHAAEVYNLQNQSPQARPSDPAEDAGSIRMILITKETQYTTP